MVLEYCLESNHQQSPPHLLDLGFAVRSRPVRRTAAQLLMFQIQLKVQT